MSALAAWLRARTPRERLLLQIAAGLLFAILLPVWAYLTAANFRNEAGTDLANARRIASQVELLSESRQAQGGGGTGSVRERTLAAAQATGLTPTRLEDAGADRLRVVFQAADSVAVYRWVEAVGRRGALVSGSAITRIGSSDQVNAEFEVTLGS